MTEEDKEKGFVVKDRRRFDSEGNEKPSGEKPLEEVKEPVKTQPASKAKPELSERQLKSEPTGELPKVEKKPGDSNSGEDHHGEMNFSSFVMSLATQALMQLGEIKPPPGMHLEVDRAAARQSIDILGMLEEKTKNNLDKEEAHLLEQILHNLRLSYVKAVS